MKVSDIYAWLFKNIDLNDHYSVFFMGQIVKELEIIDNNIGKLEYFKS